MVITHWTSSQEQLSPIQNSSADRLPSLSSTCPTTDTTENASSGGHETPSLSNHAPDLHPKPIKRPVASKVNDEAVRTANKHIRSKLREDWTWPPTSSTPDALDSLEESLEWRERDSDSDSSLASTPQDPNLDPYKYDSPDSLNQPVLIMKCKRKRRLREEMEWNEGLRTYVERRDAWAGAKKRPTTPPPAFKSPFESPYSTARPPTNNSTSLPPSPRTFIPIALPVLPPDHPIRSAVQPAVYPQIYSAIVIKGLVPTVPVNLQDLINSLVAGWKKDGEWPPKSDAEIAAQAKAADKKDRTGMNANSRNAVRRSVGKVKRVLGLLHGEDEGGDEEEGKPF